jgi:hypothetical protein
MLILPLLTETEGAVFIEGIYSFFSLKVSFIVYELFSKSELLAESPLILLKTVLKG